MTAGANAGDVNFSVDARSGPSIYNLETLAYLGPSGNEAYVHAPSLISGSRGWMVFDAPGTLVPNTTTPTPGMSVSAIGPAAKMEPDTLGYFVSAYLLSVVDTNDVSQPTPVALAVTTPDDLYVLPSAFTVVPTAGPTIKSVSASTDASGNPIATLTGDNLGLDTRVLFDGAAATSIQKNGNGSFTVGAPPAIGKHVAVLEALASDGQTSVRTMGTLPLPTFPYSSPDHPSLSITPAVVAAGTDTMIEVDGFNTNFAEGQTAIGFGSSDVVVRRTWIVSPGKALLNISINPSALAGLTTVTAATGVQDVTLNAGLQIIPGAAQQMSLRVPVLNQATGLPGIPAGGTLAVSATGLPANLQGWTLNIAGVTVDFTLDAKSNLLAVVPGSTPLGPTVLRLISPNGDSIAPVLFNVDAQPPSIEAAYDQIDSSHLTFIDANHPAAPGDVLMLDVVGLVRIVSLGRRIERAHQRRWRGSRRDVARFSAPVRPDLQRDQDSIYARHGVAGRRSAAGDSARGYARFRALHAIRYPACAGGVVNDCAIFETKVRSPSRKSYAGRRPGCSQTICSKSRLRGSPWNCVTR